MNTVAMHRLVRVESKLTSLMGFLQMERPRFTPPPTNRTYSEADVTRALVRIESQLTGLMLHLGLNPYERIQKD